MSNTEFSYLYRDAGNYKRSKTVVVEGTMTFADIQPHLDRAACDGNGFIPGQVDLPFPQVDWESDGYAFPTDDDHVYCEVEEDDIVPTDKEPTEEQTAAELVEKFKEIGALGWDVISAMKQLGINQC